MCLLTIRLEVIKYESATDPDTIINRQWEFSWGRSIKLIDDNVFYHACLWWRCVVGNMLSCIFTSTTTQLSLNATPMICTPLQKKCIWSWCNLDLWSLTLKTFLEMPTHMVNICGKFHWNPFTIEISHHTKQMLMERQQAVGWTTEYNMPLPPIVSNEGIIMWNLHHQQNLSSIFYGFNKYIQERTYSDWQQQMYINHENMQLSSNRTVSHDILCHLLSPRTSTLNNISYCHSRYRVCKHGG